MPLRLVAMDDDNQFYTFDAGLLDSTATTTTAAVGQNGGIVDPTTGQIFAAATDSSSSPDYLVDELQALNTALCFLCSINADSTEVEAFLKLHPEALLLEGACLLPEDSAHYILEQRELRCQCRGLCHVNRLRVMDLLDHVGFAKFEERRTQQQQQPQMWAVQFAELVQAEHDIRILRRQELQMRNTLIETAIEVRSYQEELDQVIQNMFIVEHQPTPPPTSRLSALAKLGCSRYHQHHPPSPSPADENQIQRRRAVLEYQVGVAAVNLRSVEREHASLLQRIREGRRTQFAVLQRAFAGCLRHEICTSTTPTNNNNNSDHKNNRTFAI